MWVAMSLMEDKIRTLESCTRDPFLSFNFARLLNVRWIVPQVLSPTFCETRQRSCKIASRI